MSSHKNKKSTYKGIRFENDLIKEIELSTDCFSKFVKQAVREKLEREKGQ